MNISIPQTINFNGLILVISCFIISAIIIFPVLGLKSITSIISFILLYALLYLIFSSMSSQNLYNELPTTLYPSMPHTGLDGISLNNYIAGTEF
jgi:tetrahydromethanopterin S-methyltransferase subunit C